MASAEIDVANDHPMRDAVLRANEEFMMGRNAAAGGNLGRVRVCARRAVGIFLQTIAPTIPDDVGTNVIANLRWVQDAARLPIEHREAAARLAGGSRKEMSGGIIS
ncbi:MAG: hypothetical protein H7X80_08245, partial [bacterium]|nr:hypothetical protein [Candidatus Kapabacteria bacterium]